MHTDIDRGQRYYFPDKLRSKLAQIAHYPLTIIEAPSGFGKTTAVREYLKENLPHGARQYWYTSLGEPASGAWKGICGLISNLDIKIATILQGLKMPTMDTLFHMSTYLKNISCHTETYLVLDNFQLVDCDIPRELISIFSMHENPKLHIIFITQQLEHRQQISIHNDNVHTINASSFFFSKSDTAKLFHLEGIRLSEEDLESVYMGTEGWVAAIRLKMINYLETDSFAPAADLEQLVEGAIWSHLSPAEREFLLSVSVFESFTASQAAFMLGKDALPGEIEELLKNNDFIRYFPEKQLYNIHSILQDYLQNRLYHYISEKQRHNIFRRAGAACAAAAEYCAAAEFYYKVKDFDTLLSLPFSFSYFDEAREKCQPQFFASLVKECPAEILGQYPFTMLAFGYLTLANGYLEEYHRLCHLLSLLVQGGNSFSPEQLRKIEGEYMLLQSLGEFNDIGEMKKGVEKAWELLGGPSQTIGTNAPYLFASPSILGVLWRDEGKLDNVLQQMRAEGSPYHRLARGNGAGACHVLQAEAMLLAGKDNEAEIYCHKALYEARSHQQLAISICAELILARLFILQGDVEDYLKAVKNIESYAREGSSPSVLHLAEFALSSLSLLLDAKDNIAPWLYDLERIKEKLYAPIVPLAQNLHLKLLLLDKQQNQFYGICQLMLEESEEPRGKIKYILARLYLLILSALAERNKGNALQGQAYLKEALELALADGIYLPFAEHEGMASFLSELPVGVFEAYAGNTSPPRADNAFENLVGLCQRWQKGSDKIKRALIRGKSPLTPREREIALLAKKRLTGKEIAAKLYISELTVRTTLRNVYSKLGINSKYELASKDF